MLQMIFLSPVTHTLNMMSGFSGRGNPFIAKTMTLLFLPQRIIWLTPASWDGVLRKRCGNP